MLIAYIASWAFNADLHALQVAWSLQCWPPVALLAAQCETHFIWQSMLPMNSLETCSNKMFDKPRKDKHFAMQHQRSWLDLWHLVWSQHAAHCCSCSSAANIVMKSSIRIEHVEPCKIVYSFVWTSGNACKYQVPEPKCSKAATTYDTACVTMPYEKFAVALMNLNSSTMLIAVTQTEEGKVAKACRR